LVREYTALIDPPGVRTAAPAMAAPAVRAAPAPVAPAATPAAPAKGPVAAPAAGGKDYGPIQRGENLSKIARSVMPEGVTLEQMLVALYRANEDAFIRKNMNLVLAGKILRVPDQAEVESVSGGEAVTVYRTYESGDRSFEVNLLFGTQAGLTWMPDYKEGWKMQTPEGLMEVKRIAGFLVYYMFENESNSGGIVVLIQEATAAKPDTGAVFAVSFEGLALDEALKTAQRFSWAKMKEQVGRLK